MSLAPTETERFTPRTDPITFEVLRHRLWQINDEQGRTVINVSGSPVASEANDFGVALTDAEGNLVTLGQYLIHHTAAISEVVRNAIESLGDEVGVGDVYLTNDPWMGALHQNDVCCVAPVHHDGTLIAWTACIVHQIDVGGPVPGSWNLDAHTAYEEAPRYRFLRVMRDGRIQNDAVSTYLTNSRTPSSLELDLRAMIASSNVVKERLAETIDRYGVGAVSDTMQDCMDYTELLLRQRLASIADGEWFAEDFMDHNGHEDGAYGIRLKLSKAGTALHFDYTETDDQTDGSINSAYAGALAGSLSPVMTQLCANIPWNQGVMRCVEIATREGTLNHARFPAPVGGASISATHHTSNAAMSAVARMITDSPSAGVEPAMANWSGSPYVYNVFGENQYGEPFGTMLIDSHLGGGGARSFDDGYTAAGMLSVPQANVPNVESVEGLSPFVYLYRRRAQDSGGAGGHRGGLAVTSAMALSGTSRLNVTVSTQGAQHSCAAGHDGGYPGAGVNTSVVRQPDTLDRLVREQRGDDVDEWGGEVELLSSKARLLLEAGDILVTSPHGGGGLKDPLLRDPASVVADVTRGDVSEQQARTAYGVVISSGELDAHATQELRLQIRTQRLDGTAPVQDSITTHRSDPALIQRVGAVGGAGPLIGRKWDGDSPFFQLHEYICPASGYLVDVQIRKRGDTRRELGPITSDD
ncbi:MAG: hydantoinase B/oxoprolinase family protein [Rhodococcus sp. (in: high G+C Gram-positive bacteria)]|uniref:hydantoinase B/oxoprolinase family protein n=1 Tax=Rhodococcus sp. TaxID=1831 RepID=UPI003BB70ECD